MSGDATGTDATGASATGDQTDASATGTDQTDAQTENGNEGNSEAARYRRRLRDTEAERDALRGQVEVMQRSEVERMADGLSDPADLWVGGVELSDLLAEDGSIDSGKVGEAVKGVLTAHPSWAKPRGSGSFDAGARGSMKASGASDWATALRDGGDDHRSFPA